MTFYKVTLYAYTNAHVFKLNVAKKADTRSHEQLQVEPSVYKAVALEETLNCKSANGEKGSAAVQVHEYRW